MLKYATLTKSNLKLGIKFEKNNFFLLFFTYCVALNVCCFLYDPQKRFDLTKYFLQKIPAKFSPQKITPWAELYI